VTSFDTRRCRRGITKGAKSAQLPVDFIIKSRTAKALGLTISQSLIAGRAD